MTAMESSTRRCVVWFGRPSEAERSRLSEAGWTVRVAQAHEESGIGRRHGDTVVALADLRPGSAQCPHALIRIMSAYPQVLWLSVLPEDAASGEVHDEVLQASLDGFAEPLDLERLLLALDDLSGEMGALPCDVAGIGGESEAIQVVTGSLRKYAPVDLPVLITGETGTGKEVAARALHDLSQRAGRPFVAINCGALPPNLVQSELFGHERGAFTGANTRRIGHIEAANGGTVFLDEIGDLPLDAQTNLLRFLQEGTLERIGSSQSIKLDVRVLAATHVDLEKAVASGRFRQDLYYRLNVLRLRMPALRERDGDVELLAQCFLDHFREHHATHARTFSRSARRAMRDFTWPGNVRELLNRVQRAAVVAEDALISAQDLELEGVAHGAASLGSTRISAERDAVIACLRESRFNVSECARRLKVSRVTIYRLCKKHQLALDELR